MTRPVNRLLGHSKSLSASSANNETKQLISYFDMNKYNDKIIDDWKRACEISNFYYPLFQLLQTLQDNPFCKEVSTAREVLKRLKSQVPDPHFGRSAIKLSPTGFVQSPMETPPKVNIISFGKFQQLYKDNVKLIFKNTGLLLRRFVYAFLWQNHELVDRSKYAHKVKPETMMFMQYLFEQMDIEGLKILSECEPSKFKDWYIHLRRPSTLILYYDHYKIHKSMPLHFLTVSSWPYSSLNPYLEAESTLFQLQLFSKFSLYKRMLEGNPTVVLQFEHSPKRVRRLIREFEKAVVDREPCASHYDYYFWENIRRKKQQRNEPSVVTMPNTNSLNGVEHRIEN